MAKFSSKVVTGGCIDLYVIKDGKEIYLNRFPDHLACAKVVNGHGRGEFSLDDITKMTFEPSPGIETHAFDELDTEEFSPSGLYADFDTREGGVVDDTHYL